MLYRRRQLLPLSQSGFKQLLSECLTDKFYELQRFNFSHFQLIEDYEQGALQKESIFAPFVERFEAGTFRTSS